MYQKVISNNMLGRPRTDLRYACRYIVNNGFVYSMTVALVLFGIYNSI